MDFTSREIASGVIVVGFVLLSFLLSEDRKKLVEALLGVAKAFGQWKVWTVILAYIGYLSGVVLLAHVLGGWSTDLLKDTLIIGVFVGLPILLNSTDFEVGQEVVRHVTREVFGVTALLVVYVNLRSFPLWGELILQVSLLLFMMLSMVGVRDPKTASIGRFFGGLAGVIVLGLLTHVSVQVVTNFHQIEWQREAATFVLSVWLPVSLIPFIYFFGLISACESALIQVKIHNHGEMLPLLVRLGFLLGLHGSLRYASAFKGLWLPKLASQGSYGHTRRMMHEYRRSVRRNARKNSERRRRLKRNAGKRAVDDNGLWLDRREFYETKEALDGLFFSQMGLYRAQGGRYWSDPTFFFPARGFKNLPEGHGVRYRVSDDGQAWVAWRKTVGGFFLGIGGTCDLEAYWRYASTEAPTKYPSEGSAGWADISKDPEASPEWNVNDGPIQLTEIADFYTNSL